MRKGCLDVDDVYIREAKQEPQISPSVTISLADIAALMFRPIMTTNRHFTDDGYGKEALRCIIFTPDSFTGDRLGSKVEIPV